MLRNVSIALAMVMLISISSFAQNKEAGVGITVDSLHVQNRSLDSLIKLDSLEELKLLEEQRKLDNAKQFASQREIDVTNDGKPEIIRLVANVARDVDDSRMTLTIRSGKKLLYEDSWKAGGYFDTIDHLSDSVKRRRLRRIVNVFFANENFTVLDSDEFTSLLKLGTPADVAMGSPVAKELIKDPRVMYSVYVSRDYWYGLVWLPSTKKFVKAWRN